MDTDSDSSEREDVIDVDENDRNIEGKFHSGFISAWAEDNEGVEEEEKPHESNSKEILWAAENGDVETIKRLLVVDKNLTKSTDKDGYTPLHRAAYNNQWEILELLLEADADVNAETIDGWKPLHSACHWNSVACVEKLISLDIDVNAQTHGGITPLHLAATNNQGLETLQVLLLHPNLNIIIKNNSNETAYEIALGKSQMAPKYFEVTEPCFNFI